MVSGSDLHVGEAVLYDADDDLVSVAGPFLRAGLASGGTVLLVTSDRRGALLTAAVGGDPRLSVMAPPGVWQRPMDAAAFYQRLIEDHAAAGRRLWIVADSDHGPGPVDWSEWARFEAVSHHAAGPYPVRSLCLLDRRVAPAEVVAKVRRLHPVLWTGGAWLPSPDFAGAAENVRRDAYVHADPLEETPATLRARDLTGAADLAEMRHALAAQPDLARLPPWRSHEFVLAVGEVAANAVRHGRPPVVVRYWATPHRLLCTVTDHGSGFDYPLSSYLPLDPVRAGLGLYLVRQLCDQVNVRWTPEGFTVRLGLLVG